MPGQTLRECEIRNIIIEKNNVNKITTSQYMSAVNLLDELPLYIAANA
jgi:hypothetical protein